MPNLARRGLYTLHCAFVISVSVSVSLIGEILRNLGRLNKIYQVQVPSAQRDRLDFCFVINLTYFQANLLRHEIFESPNGGKNGN